MSCRLSVRGAQPYAWGVIGGPSGGGNTASVDGSTHLTLDAAFGNHVWFRIPFPPDEPSPVITVTLYPEESHYPDTGREVPSITVSGSLGAFEPFHEWIIHGTCARFSGTVVLDELLDEPSWYPPPPRNPWGYFIGKGNYPNVKIGK